MTEPKKPTFRRQAVQAPPPAEAVQVPKIEAPEGGNLPVPTGTVFMSDYVKTELTKLGWKEGDPIPGDFGVQIQKMQKQMQAESGQKPDMGFKPGDKTKMGQTVNISDLPEEKQQELAQHLASYKEEVIAAEQERQEMAERVGEIPDDADPSVVDAQQTAARAEMAAEAMRAHVAAGGDPAAFEQPGGMPEVSYVQSNAVDTSKLPKDLRPPEGSQVHGADNLMETPIPTPEPEPEPAPMPTPEPEPEPPMSAGGAAKLARCPRCLWDLEQPFEMEPSRQDKEVFVAAILGATRFTKEVTIMDGQVGFVFRSLLSNETDLLFQQLGIDMRNGEFSSDADYFMRLQEYRLYMSVGRIIGKNGEVLVEIPPIFEIPYDEPEKGHIAKTRLVDMKEWFNDEAVPNESLRRVMVQHHRQFQRLVEALEAMTSESDFWKGIGSST